MSTHANLSSHDSTALAALISKIKQQSTEHPAHLLNKRLRLERHARDARLREFRQSSQLTIRGCISTLNGYLAALQDVSHGLDQLGELFQDMSDETDRYDHDLSFTKQRSLATLEETQSALRYLEEVQARRAAMGLCEISGLGDPDIACEGACETIYAACKNPCKDCSSGSVLPSTPGLPSEHTYVSMPELMQVTTPNLQPTPVEDASGIPFLNLYDGADFPFSTGPGQSPGFGREDSYSPPPADPSSSRPEKREHSESAAEPSKRACTNSGKAKTECIHLDASSGYYAKEPRVQLKDLLNYD